MRFQRLLWAAPVVLLIGTAPTWGHTCDDPMVVDLIAGKHTKVGTVEVCNDGCYLYVTYKTEGDWCLKETHLHVAAMWQDIPQTRKGNPIPGRFDYKACHNPCVMDYQYKIERTWGCDEVVHIAAHAEVVTLHPSAKVSEILAI